MIKTTALTDSPRDPWAHAPASWIPLPGTRAERLAAQRCLKPLLWEAVVRPEDRALVAHLAGEVLTSEPDVARVAFGGRLLEAVRARAATTTHPVERDRMQQLDTTLSRELVSLPDLLDRVRALRANEAAPMPTSDIVALVGRERS